MLDIAEAINREFGDEPMLRDLMKNKRFFGLGVNCRAGEIVSCHLRISYLSASEKERKRQFSIADNEE